LGKGIFGIPILVVLQKGLGKFPKGPIMGFSEVVYFPLSQFHKISKQLLERAETNKNRGSKRAIRKRESED